LILVVSLMYGCYPVFGRFGDFLNKVTDVREKSVALVTNVGNQVVAGSGQWIDQRGNQLKELVKNLNGDLATMVNSIGSVTGSLVTGTLKPDVWWGKLPEEAKVVFSEAQLVGESAYKWVTDNAPGLICLSNAGVTTASSGPVAPIVGFATVTACVCQFPELGRVMGVIIYQSTKPLCAMQGVPPELVNVCKTLEEKKSGIIVDLVTASGCGQGVIGGIVCIISVVSGTYAAKKNPPNAAIVGTSGFVSCLCAQEDNIQAATDNIKAAIESFTCDSLMTLIQGAEGEFAKGLCNLIKDSITGLNTGDILSGLDCKGEIGAGATCIANQMAAAGMAGSWDGALTGISTCVCGKQKLMDFIRNPPMCRLLSSIHEGAGETCKTVVNLGVSEVTKNC